jgi:hypothetical protein
MMNVGWFKGTVWWLWVKGSWKGEKMVSVGWCRQGVAGNGQIWLQSQQANNKTEKKIIN